MITIGSKVQITNSKSVAHLQVGNLSITGTVSAIDYNNYVGRHLRPVLIEFPDRPGTWSYAFSEVKGVEDKQH